MLNGHLQELTVTKSEPSRLIKFADIESQSFHKFIKFVPCATILNTFSTKKVYEYTEQEPILRILLCFWHQYMAYFTYLKFLVYPSINTCEYSTCHVLSYPSSTLSHIWPKIIVFVIYGMTNFFKEWILQPISNLRSYDEF